MQKEQKQNDYFEEQRTFGWKFLTWQWPMWTKRQKRLNVRRENSLKTYNLIANVSAVIKAGDLLTLLKCHEWRQTWRMSSMGKHG